ncbi:MAG: bifunctional aspartate kinase/homoserine dehydrogenase I [bacterium]
MKILKFGGTSIATPERIENVLDLLTQARQRGEIAVVVSAFGGVTNMLIEASRLAARGSEAYLGLLSELEQVHREALKVLVSPEPQSAPLSKVSQKLESLRDILHGIFLVKELSPRSLDLIMSYGERLSAFIISASLRRRKVPAEYLNASALVKTDDQFGNARVDSEWSNGNIKKYFEDHSDLQIITGFIASTENNEITTLGRSGSDYTAAIFAAALEAEEVEIWTDVDGVLTADPRLVPNAFCITSMSYAEAMELSHFGSEVVHPKCMQPALEKNIPLRIRNTFNPSFSGTLICREPEPNPFIIRGISAISDITLLQVQGSGMLGVTGISARLFGALARARINVILITQASSEHSICFAVTPHSAVAAKKAIEEEFNLEILAHQIEEVVLEDKLSVVAVVGERMRGIPGIAARIFHALGKHGSNVVAIAQGSSELNISIVVAKSEVATALNAIHETFFVRDRKTLHLFLVGPGLVGGRLLEQVQTQLDFLNDAYALEIKLNGLANSKKMVFDPEGIPLAEWCRQLASAGEKMDLDRFVEKMKMCHFRNSIFLDCTASAAIVQTYERILNLGISIVTPNKKANSSTYEQYQRLKTLAIKRGVRFFYETNVGASLPIISTLNDLTLSGDNILKIEAIISGTISFVFNSFDGSRPFSEIVKEAKDKGFTEPDPRDDLNGMDVARKLLIVAREVGLECELEDIAVENILPVACQRAASVEDFFVELERNDGYFASKVAEAQQEGKVLRYIATIENNQARVALQAVPREHPFYHMSGSENIIAITSSRYCEQPLVIKGPGAGAEVTAAGIFADIIRIGNS